MLKRMKLIYFNFNRYSIEPLSNIIFGTRVVVILKVKEDRKFLLKL